MRDIQMLCEKYMDSEEILDIDRKPSKGEKILGIFCSGIFFIISFVAFIGITFILHRDGIDKLILAYFFVTLFLSVYSFYLLFRFLCTPPKRPGKFAVKILPYIFIVAGVGILILSFLVKEHSLSALAIGLMSVVRGLTTINHHKLRKNT
jgi:hypothetical protein